MFIDKFAQKRSLTNRISPAKTFGKWRTKLRSPKYAKALSFVEKSDNLIREAVSRQKTLLREMKKAKGNYSASLFLNNLNSFKSEQLVINKIIQLIGAKFDEIKGDDYDTIDEAINQEILRTPKQHKLNFTEEDDDTVSDKLIGKLSENIENLKKQAFWGDSYWKENIQSGKSYVEAFSILYSKFDNIFQNNISLLKILDDLRTVGDPVEYLNVAKNQKTGFVDIKKALIDPKIAEPLNKLKAIFKEKKETPEVAAEQKEIKFEPIAGEKMPPKTPNIKPVESKDVANKKYEESVDKLLAEKKAEYVGFSKTLIKMANSEVVSMADIINETLKFAEYIDEQDPNTSLKLLSIIEGEVDANQ